jgi:hypothetical protein
MKTLVERGGAALDGSATPMEIPNMLLDEGETPLYESVRSRHLDLP